MLSLSQYLRDCSYPTKVLGPSFIIFLPYFYIKISCLSFNIIDFYHFFFLFQYQQYFVFFVCTQQWQCFLWCYHFKKYFCRACWHDAIARTRTIAIKQNKAQFCNIANMLMVFASFDDKYHWCAQDLQGDGSSTF